MIDNDFDPAQYGGAAALESLRVTLAHEYAHVLQYGYDVLADGWHYEASAVWMEQRMYPAITGLAALPERRLARRRLAVAHGAPAHLLRAEPGQRRRARSAHREGRTATSSGTTS